MEVSAADYPKIRMFTAEWTMHEAPQLDVAGLWNVCTPETVGDFSAVAYFFGRDLEEKLRVPIGLITCAYGASTAEAWISRESLVPHPQFQTLLEAYGAKRLAFRDNPNAMTDYGKAMARWREDTAKRKQQGKGPTRAPKHPDPVQDQHNPSVLFNGMIAPITPYPIRGAIWYQGESNVGTRAIYPDLQQALIEDWRKHWNNEQLPFYFVQLAAYNAPPAEPGNSRLASMREAQASSLSIPHTGMALAIDLGEAKDIHPRNKQDVGHRLARIALADTYKQNIIACGPVFREQEIEKDRIRLHFDHIADGLASKDGVLNHFAIAGNDRKFVWAEAVIQDDSVVVHSPAVADPAYVRYAWADNPDGANLYNTENLPAAPFRTDP